MNSNHAYEAYVMCCCESCGISIDCGDILCPRCETQVTKCEQRLNKEVVHEASISSC